ncbi:MAG: hypothetical protein BZ136_05925, partial [Methanosphaera sp. rholeuAM74]
MIKIKPQLKINETVDIDAKIEIQQRLGRKYDIKITQLEKQIQYQIRKLKITQTYQKTILKQDTMKILDKLGKSGKIVLIIIKNSINNDEKQKLQEKIRKIDKLPNTKTITTKQKNIYKTLDKIIEAELK